MLNELLSDSGKISSRRVIGFSSFIIGSAFGIAKAFFIPDIPMELVYSFLGLSSTALFATAFKK